MKNEVSLKSLNYVIFLMICISLMVGITASAQEKQTEEAINSKTRILGPTDPEELEAFLDKFFAAEMEKKHIPGLVFVMVKDGEIFFAKGYGYADLEKKRPVIPDKTLFRIASVSKLFAATAVMQLYEQGELNLNDDVNKHLKLFQLEENFPQPVTVTNLLTHTGGFEDKVIGAAARKESEMIPLGQYLAARMPSRVLPPGDVISYSNHGFALAGYLVEEISGIPFEQYIEENILQPLGMDHSSFLLPSHLEPDLAIGYNYSKGRYQPVPYIHIHMHAYPAGSMSATATDMARFMIAHLQNGRYGDNWILDEETAQEMHQQHFTHHPQLPGWCYGFYEYFKNGQRAILHDGDLPGYASRLFLLPEHNLGFFVSYNNVSYKLRDDVAQILLDHYYPLKEKPAPAQPSTDFKSRAHRFIGSYRYNRYARRTLEKMLSVAIHGNVAVSDEGTLIVNYPPILSVEPSHWVQVEPLLFQRIDGEGFMSLREDDKARITHLFLDLLGSPIGLEKLTWYETNSFHIGLIGFILLVFLSVCVVWPVGHLIRRRRKLPAEGRRTARFARLLAALTIALNLIFIIGFAVSMYRIGEDLIYGMSPVVIALLVIPIVITILTIGLVIFTVLGWKNKYWSLLGRLYYSLITLACIGFIFFLNYWNLLGFRY